jgi:hypothetical protein
MIPQQAPYGRVDFDAPPGGQTNSGALTAIRLGVFPGSLGNYSGVDLTISKVTVERPPGNWESSKSGDFSMWQDLQI